MKLRILLADDHQIFRQALRIMLETEPDLEIVAEAGDGLEVIRLAREMLPDIVVMDIGMPNLNGIEATRQLLADNPRVKVMALSTHSDGAIVAKMLKAGASGYMLKESAFSELMEGIAAMMEGKTYLCSKIAKVVFSDYVTMLSSPQWPGGDGLSSRENEVLQLVAEGKTSKEISQALNVSVKTVDSHREHIMEKLSIHNVAGLTKYAVREGITSPW